MRWYRFEIYFGPFELAIPLPGDVHVDRDRIVGSYKDGFLLVVLPKMPQAERAVARTIPVTGE